MFQERNIFEPDLLKNDWKTAMNSYSIFSSIFYFKPWLEQSASCRFQTNHILCKHNKRCRKVKGCTNLCIGLKSVGKPAWTEEMTTCRTWEHAARSSSRGMQRQQNSFRRFIGKPRDSFTSQLFWFKLLLSGSSGYTLRLLRYARRLHSLHTKRSDLRNK